MAQDKDASTRATPTNTPASFPREHPPIATRGPTPAPSCRGTDPERDPAAPARETAEEDMEIFILTSNERISDLPADGFTCPSAGGAERRTLLRLYRRRMRDDQALHLGHPHRDL